MAANRLGLLRWVLVPSVVAIGIVSQQPWHGPTVLTLSATHGVDAGDLVVFPLLLAVLAAARRRFARRDVGAAGWALPGCSLLLGLLLVSSGLWQEGGPLIPAGGATPDGTVRRTFGDQAVRVGRWTNVALTYDGSEERLYVNGRVAAGHAAAGPFRTPRSPLWIGGGDRFGAHFDGLIDDVRVYDRALTPREIRRDMTAPVRPAPGLVAGYAFDAGSGTRAKDSSGEGNTGHLQGATWTRGRHGDALRFNGVNAAVRVPESRSLDRAGAITLSAWILPSARQAGWRTIVQRPRNLYYLAASSARYDRTGWKDTARFVLLVAAALWFCVLIATGRGPSSAARRRIWWLPVVLFGLGSCADAALAPHQTICGCLLVALWLAATASGPIERTGLLIAAAACAGVTITSLGGSAALGTTLARDPGALARSTALGAIFLLAASAALWGALSTRGVAGER